MTKRFLFFLALALVFTLLYLGYDYYQFTQQRQALVLAKGEQTTASLRDQVNAILDRIAGEGEQLAQRLGQQDYSQAEIEALVKESALRIPEIQGVTACFEPYAFKDQQRLFCPYYNKGSQSYLYIDESYDYTVPGEGTTWYTSIRDDGASWVEPYYARAAKDWYVDYGIPFYYGSGPRKGQVRGTITMSFVCSGFKNLIHSMSLGKTGYGLITSRAGTFLAHPINDYVGTTHLDSLSDENTPADLREAYQQLLAGQSGFTRFYDANEDDQGLFFYDSIPASGWGIGLYFLQNDLLNDATQLNRRYLRLALILSLLFLCLLAIYYNKDYLDEGEIWRLSMVSSVLLLANIFLVAYLQHHTPQNSVNRKSPPIIDLMSLSSFVHQQELRAERLKAPSVRAVPTGIYLHRMEFEDSYNLNVGGQLWQKYPLELADEVEIGFQFPQLSPFAESSLIEERYRDTIAAKEDEAAYLLVGWEFRVTLRLNFQYANYPLDKRHINIEILPLNAQDHLLFVPDLASYSYTNPSRKSGLDHKIQFPGSEVLESYFNYSIETYATDFGYGQKSLYEDVPVLHFNIHLRRLLLNAFVTYLIPIFVSLIMMFILLYSCTKSQERQGIIESMAAFFFVLVFSHIDLRREIVTAELIYLEFFYFVTYLMVILSTYNLITYTKDKSAIFDFNDNQLFKALYFPFFLFLILVITWRKFY